MSAEGQGADLTPSVDPDGLSNLLPPDGDPKHLRETLRMLRMAVRRGWPITDRGMRVAVERMEAIAESTNEERQAVGASRVLVAMRQSNLDALGLLDKLERLDAGQATERVEFGPMKF